MCYTSPMIRETIATELARRGWAKAELARRSGVQRPQVVNYLSGRRDARGETLEKLLQALKLEIRPQRGKGAAT